MLWDVFPDGEHFGGAPANVAMHAAALGAEAALVSAVGHDARGDAVLERLGVANVDRSAMIRLSDHPTGIVYVNIGDSGAPSYEIVLECAWDYVPWSAAALRVTQRADAICFGTLGQRSPVSRATIRRAVTATRNTTWRLFDVNLRAPYYDAGLLVESLELANALKLNEEELPVVAGLCGLAGGSPVEQLRALCQRFWLRLAALTQGPKGSMLVTAGDVWHAPAPKTSVVDTVGAGDAFTATLLVGILAGESLAAVNRRANVVAAYVCSQPGATPAIPASL